jgi:hypothetical protein
MKSLNKINQYLISKALANMSKAIGKMNLIVDKKKVSKKDLYK